MSTPAAQSIRTQSELDPHGKDAHEGGSKLDAGKSLIEQGVFAYFPRALLAVADVSEHGSIKYVWGGWKSVPGGVNRYANARGRHILKQYIEGPYDRDSDLLHKAHEAWNVLAELELMLTEGTPLKNPASERVE